MPIDPSIPLQVQTPKLQSPLENAAQALSLKGAMQESQLRDLQYKSTLKSMDEEEQFKKALADPAAYERDPVTQTVIPKSDTIKQLYSISPTKAQALQKTITENQKAAFAMQKDQLETSSKKLDMVHQVASGALDKYDQLVSQGIPAPVAAQQVQPLYQQSVGELRSANLLSPQELQNIPPQFDPERARQGVAQMISAKDKMAMKQKQLEDEEKIRHNLQTEKTSESVQKETARYHNQEIGIRQQELKAKQGNIDPETIESNADLIGQGKMAAPTGAALRNPSMQKIMQRVNEKYPDFSAKQFATESKAEKDFATGKQGNAVRSFNVSLRHLDTLDQLSDALNNKDTQLINKIGNTVSTQMGVAAPVNFNAAKKIVADEIVKAIVGSGGGVADREEAAKTIDAANSPAQLKGVINTYKELMKGQLHGLRDQYKATTGKDDFDTKYLSKEAREVAGDNTHPDPKYSGFKVVK